jgi:L,D-transpeptidase YcbB
VVFKPSWTVPASIIVNEYGPKSRKDPGYLDRQGYKLIDMRTNKPIDSSRSIDWYKMGQSPYFTVQQPPGDDNALGDLKFLFPNAHSIYMHDTPNRNLFTESERAFSHGCVRVQNPREFASVLLGWDADKIDANVDMDESHSVNLGQKVPVYLTYFTAWPTAEGKIMYYNDIYGRDDAMAKAFGDYLTGKPKAPSDEIVQTGDLVGGLNQN